MNISRNSPIKCLKFILSFLLHISAILSCLCCGQGRRALRCHTGIKDEWAVDKGGMWYLCCLEGQAGGMQAGRGRKKREIEGGKGKESQNNVGLYQFPRGRMITSILPFTHPLYNGRIYHTVPVHRVAFSSSEEMIWKCKSSYSLKAVPRYNLQKYPARVLQDVCLSGSCDENVILKSLKWLHPNLKWEQMHSKMGPVRCLLVSAYFVWACKFPLSLF